MSNFRKRLVDVEERQAVRDYRESQREFEGRTHDELRFFTVYGYFPEGMEGQLPQRQEFTVGGFGWLPPQNG